MTMQHDVHDASDTHVCTHCLSKPEGLSTHSGLLSQLFIVGRQKLQKGVAIFKMSAHARHRVWTPSQQDEVGPHLPASTAALSHVLLFFGGSNLFGKCKLFQIHACASRIQ